MHTFSERGKGNSSRTWGQVLQALGVAGRRPDQEAHRSGRNPHRASRRPDHREIQPLYPALHGARINPRQLSYVLIREQCAGNHWPVWGDAPPPVKLFGDAPAVTGPGSVTPAASRLRGVPCALGTPPWRASGCLRSRSPPVAHRQPCRAWLRPALRGHGCRTGNTAASYAFHESEPSGRAISLPMKAPPSRSAS